MRPAPHHKGLGYFFMGLAVLLVAALTAGYIWSVVNGEAAVVTAATAIIVFAAGEFFTRRRVAQQYRWDRVADVYEEFIGVLGEMSEHEEDTHQWREAQNRAMKIMRTFSNQLLLWGSPGVIQAWANSQRLAAEDAPGEEMLFQWFRIVLAIRKDLGHSDLTLDERDLLRVIIKDIDDLLPPGTRL